jgi:hypothetical protein
MKVIILTKTTRMIIISSLIASLGFLTLPLPSTADREYIYKNCAQLQKIMNEYNPGAKFEGFENVKMMRRTLGYEKYMIFCNGGIITDGSEGTICNGYIGYSFSRIGGGAQYYGTWGRTNGLPNFNDNDKGNYCRWIN